MAVRASKQLSAGELEALAALEARAVGADGGRLKLEWGALRSRPGHAPRDFTWWEQDTLLGFAGLYAFNTAKVEIAGMVDPGARRRGIASALLDAALTVCREHGGESVLLVVPRNSPGGRQLALGRGAQLEHSEHAMVLRCSPPPAPANPALSLRAADLPDLEVLSELMLAGFGHPLSGPEELLPTERSQTLVAEYRGRVAGTVRLSRDGDRGGVYGFTIAPQLRGQGIGREVLSRVCRELLSSGMREVGLEVAVDNDHALGLYRSVGFTPLATEDYYELGL